MGQQGPLGAKKDFFQNDRGPHGMPKQVFLARFELVVACFGPPKILKSCFGSKMGQKCAFPKMILDHLGCTNKWNEPILSPLQAFLATPKSQNALKMGCFRTKNQSKMDQKCVFPKIPLDYVGCTNKWNQPILRPC